MGVDRRLYEQTEEMLIAADVGVDGTIKIVDELEQRCDVKKIETVEPFQNELADVVAELLRPADPELQRIDVTHQPTVILMVGVNGVGKTTTIGKLARAPQGDGEDALMVAGDTFRAAAVEQLEEWAKPRRLRDRQEPRTPTRPRSRSTASPRSLGGADVVLVDTAGRLHTKANLMREIEKVRKVIESARRRAARDLPRLSTRPPARTGCEQAQEFKQAVDITGIVLTKLDGTAKGGIVVAIHETLGMPIKLIGVGEQLEDLRPFEPDIFARAIFGSADGYEAASDVPAGDVTE